MQSSNPILNRYEKKPDGSGFAYAEGKNAYTQATGASAPQAPTAPVPPPGAGGGRGPVDTDAAFQQITAGGGARLTINDVLVKSVGVFVVTVVFAILGWNLVEAAPWIVWGAMIVGLVLGLVNAFKRQVSPVLVLAYAVFQGLFLGGISNWYNQFASGATYEGVSLNGVVLQAVVATMTTFGVMLALYLTGIIKVTKKFQSIVIGALVTYVLIGLASVVAGLLGLNGGWGFLGVGFVGVLICLAGVLIAAFFLLLDFQAIADGIRMGAPERESWRMAFGLLLTLIWLYLEFLRLFAIISRN